MCVTALDRRSAVPAPVPAPVAEASSKRVVGLVIVSNGVPMHPAAVSSGSTSFDAESQIYRQLHLAMYKLRSS